MSLLSWEHRLSANLKKHFVLCLSEGFCIPCDVGSPLAGGTENCLPEYPKYKAHRLAYRRVQRFIESLWFSVVQMGPGTGGVPTSRPVIGGGIVELCICLILYEGVLDKCTCMALSEQKLLDACEVLSIFSVLSS